MIALRRGLVISASPGCALLLSAVSPALSSLFFRFSRQQEQCVGSKRRAIPCDAVSQIPSLSRILGSSSSSSAWIISSRRSFHEPLTNERKGLESSAEDVEVVEEKASVPEKRLGWKRTPVFGFPTNSNKWTERRSQGPQQRNRRHSAGNGNLEGAGGGGTGAGAGGISSREWSTSTRRAVSDPQTVGDKARDREIVTRERAKEGQGRSPSSDQDFKGNSDSNRSSIGHGEGGGGNSQANGKLPFKPKAKYYDTLSKSHPEGGGGNFQAHGKPPLKPKATYYDTLGKVTTTQKPPFKPRANYYDNLGNAATSQKPPFKPRANYYDTRRNSATAQKPPFKPRANYYDSLGNAATSQKPPFKSRANYQDTQGNAATAQKPPFKPKANYYDTLGNAATAQKPPFKPKVNYYNRLGQSQRDGEVGGKSQSNRRPSFQLKANYYDTVGESHRESGTSSSKSSSSGRADGQVRDDRNSISSSEEGPHYGYKFRLAETELGQFRRIGPPGRSFAGGDRQGRRPDFRGSAAAPKRQTVMESSKGTGSPADHTEEGVVLRKYPPRRLEGEKRWQYAVRKKQLGLAGHTRGSTRKKPQQFVDDEELGDEPRGDDWRRKRIGWLCKEIPPLRPRPLVTILNEQRKWIHAEDIKYIVEHLLQINQTLRAHRVLKWEMQQPWHEFDYELSTKVAVQLAQNNKLSRTRDIYDYIIKNGKVPDLRMYVGLINCYIADGENQAVGQAWSLYNQMIQLGGHEPQPTLRYNLFQVLVQKGINYIDQADEVFKSIKMAGLVCSTEMYSLLIHAHGTKGNKDRVDTLIKEMKETGLSVGQDVHAAILRACTKDGNVAVAEQAFADLKMAGHEPISSVYSSLIKTYGKAGLVDKAFQTFEEMRAAGRSPNLIVYEPMIEVAASSGNKELAERLLKEAQERRTPSLHSCYNALMELYSKNGLLDELERLFHEMEVKGCPPNLASYNVLLEAYVRRGLLEKAEAVYEDVKAGGRVRPNKETYELMIKLYGEEKNTEKLSAVFKELANKKLGIPEGANKYLEAAVSQKQLEAHKNAQLKLNREQREILAGVLLGGANMESHDRNRTYEFHFGLDPNSEVGSPLLNHLFQLFSPWSTAPPKQQPLPDPKDPSKSKTLLAFQTVSHGSFRFFAHQYRPNYSAAIPRLVHRWLTPRAMAYWYMYGGSRCPHTGDILFNASAYTEKEIMLVVNALKARTMDCEKKRTNAGLAICFSGRSAIWVWGLMEPYILRDVKDFLKPEVEGGMQEDLNQQA